MRATGQNQTSKREGFQRWEPACGWRTLSAVSTALCHLPCLMWQAHIFEYTFSMIPFICKRPQISGCILGVEVKRRTSFFSGVISAG